MDTAAASDVLELCLAAYDAMGDVWESPWMPGSLGGGPPSLTDVFGDSSLWNEALMTGCRNEGTVPSPDLAPYRDGDFELGPPLEYPFLRGHDSLLLSEWHCLACPYPTVNIRSKTKIEVTFPFATGLVWRSRTGSLVRRDLNEVVKLLWRVAYERFMATRRGQGADVKFCRGVAWHKRDEEEVRGVQYVTARCATNRPAFLVLTEGQVTGADTVLLYMYCAMGLPGAHELQQTVLARVSSLALAAALVKAAVTLLDFRYADESVCSETQSSRQSGTSS